MPNQRQGLCRPIAGDCMSDTPETDSLMDVWRVGKLLSVSVMLDHARKLERERNEARALAAEMKQAIIWAKEVITQ